MAIKRHRSSEIELLLRSTPLKLSPTRTTKHSSRPEFQSYDSGKIVHVDLSLTFFTETFEIIEKYLDWDANTLTVMSIIHDSLANGQLAEKFPRSTNTLDFLHLLLDEGGRYVSVRVLEKVLGYSTPTFRRAFAGRSQDDSILHWKYKPNTTKDKLDHVIEEQTKKFIELKAPMKSWPPVRIISGTFRAFFEQYQAWAKEVSFSPCCGVVLNDSFPDGLQATVLPCFYENFIRR